MSSSGIPRPPPPPRRTSAPPVVDNRPAPPSPPSVAASGPPEALLLELLVANGHPFKDHWSYFLRSREHPDVGVVVHATGDVANGFRLEAKRCFNLGEPENQPTKRIPLQWLEGRFFDEQGMMSGGVSKFDEAPVGAWEESVHKIRAPGKTLNTVGDGASKGRKVMQKNCQWWIVQSAAQLVADGMLSPEVAAYLRVTAQ
ncbi:hypothetical protein ISF_06830 [Cordyceps fumosorosea ARSEF 2679]|uniref:Uncharacterized protein n=1 Tax=Cordyceps fumosorosea (strain ARSEF 2679) TaxID=1081104 RepID=A0A167R5J8_CORFA|nr:hypothetical protein ISF_06830 [Cordyceps fumosorosea ARSEF 2679]OAA58291.1 hypothetical protein ISF_06830 [Cordyceps fumosorosea ARSEF 2679]